MLANKSPNLAGVSRLITACISVFIIFAASSCFSFFSLLYSSTLLRKLVIILSGSLESKFFKEVLLFSISSIEFNKLLKCSSSSFGSSFEVCGFISRIAFAKSSLMLDVFGFFRLSLLFLPSSYG